MSGERAVFLDSSAIVKLVVAEPETSALRQYLRRKRRLVCSALAHVEVRRAALPLGDSVVVRAEDVLRRLDSVRITDRILRRAGTLQPAELRSLDAIHLATATELGADLARICTYDDRMKDAAAVLKLPTISPK